MEQWSNEGTKVMLHAPFDKAMMTQLKWKKLELASRRFCEREGQREI